MTIPMYAGVAIAAACGLLSHVVFASLLTVRLRQAGLLVLATLAAAAPLMLPAERSVGRFLSAVFAVMIVFKMCELYRLHALGLRLAWHEHWRFMVNICALSYRTTARAPRPTLARNSRHLVRGLVGVLGAVLALSAVQYLYTPETAHWLEHIPVAICLLAFVVFELEVLVAITRLAGAPSIEGNDRPWLATTPADFWRRYNRFIGQFLHDNVFRPMDGKHHPARAMLAAFAASGLMHEYVFWVAIERAAGLQMLFFMAQGIGVVLTARIKPRGASIAVWRLGTWAFMLVTSVPFFASFHFMFPVYRNGLPAWLVGW